MGGAPNVKAGEVAEGVAGELNENDEVDGAVAMASGAFAPNVNPGLGVTGVSGAFCPYANPLEVVAADAFSAGLWKLNPSDVEGPKENG